MDEGVFLGAAPHNIEFLQQKTGAFEGFRGCVRLVRKLEKQEKFVYLDGNVLQVDNPINVFLTACRQRRSTSKHQ